jgi:hypothetical protein
MEKQGFLHLHGLLSEVASFYRDRGIEIDLSEYRKLDVRPTSLNKSKDDHKKAVYALAYGLNSEDRIEEKLEDVKSEKPKVRWETAKRMLEKEADPVDENYAEVELEYVWNRLGRAPGETLKELEEKGHLVQLESPAGETRYSPDTKVYLEI